jgi:hypothetical protein
LFYADNKTYTTLPGRLAFVLYRDLEQCPPTPL